MLNTICLFVSFWLFFIFNFFLYFLAVLGLAAWAPVVAASGACSSLQHRLFTAVAFLVAGPRFQVFGLQ